MFDAKVDMSSIGANAGDKFRYRHTRAFQILVEICAVKNQDTGNVVPGVVIASSSDDVCYAPRMRRVGQLTGVDKFVQQELGVLWGEAQGSEYPRRAL